MGDLRLRDPLRWRAACSAAGSPTCSAAGGCSSRGSSLFSVSSLLCGLAWSEASLIGFRALQGLGGALLAPAALSLLMTMFAEGRERNLALGIYGAASGSGAAVGVLLGGLLTSYLSWSWVFFINVPVGIAAIALTPALLPARAASNLAHRHFDVRGAATDHGRADAARLRDHPRDEPTAGAPRRRSGSSASRPRSSWPSS